MFLSAFVGLTHAKRYATYVVVHIERFVFSRVNDVFPTLIARRKLPVPPYVVALIFGARSALDSVFTLGATQVSNLFQLCILDRLFNQRRFNLIPQLDGQVLYELAPSFVDSEGSVRSTVANEVDKVSWALSLFVSYGGEGEGGSGDEETVEEDGATVAHGLNDCVGVKRAGCAVGGGAGCDAMSCVGEGCQVSRPEVGCKD